MSVHPVHKAPDVDATTRAFIDLAMVVDWNERDDADAAAAVFAFCDAARAKSPSLHWRICRADVPLSSCRGVK